MYKRLLLVMALMATGTYQVAAQTRVQHSAQVNQTVPEASSNGSQVSPQQSDPEVINTLLAQLEGTYEVETSIPDYRVNFTRILLETIKSSRQPDVEVLLEWDEFTTIIIKPIATLETEVSGN